MVQWRMPNSAMERLSQTGFLFLQHPATEERINVTTACEAVEANRPDRLIVPFHVEANLSVRPRGLHAAEACACSRPSPEQAMRILRNL